MIRISQGISRTVIAFGAYVLKVPRADARGIAGATIGDAWRRFLWGLLANMQEADYGRRRWAGLCPVVAAVPGGLAVVMRRASVCTGSNFDAGAARQVVQRAAACGHCIPAEIKPDSWGRLEGELVAVDYG